MFVLGFCLSFARVAAEAPPELRPRVEAGRGFLEKSRVFGSPQLGGITGIALRKPRRDAEAAIIVAFTGGAAFLQLGGYKLLDSIRMNDGNPPFLPHHVLDADADGDVEFLREPGAGVPATLLDDRGKLLWQASPPGPGFPRVTFGEMDGDGKVLFLLWSYPSSKVELRDSGGQVLWGQTWENGLNEVQVRDTDGDGKAEFVYIDGKAFYIRDRRGALVRREVLEAASYVNALHAIRFPDRKGRLCWCVGFNIDRLGKDIEQVYRILELEGKTFIKDLKPSELVPYLPAETMTLDGREPGYQARVEELKYQGQLVGFSATRLQLFVHDSEGVLCYHEVIASSEGERARGDGAMAVVPTRRDGGERLLVGYGPDMWEYRLAKR